MLQKKFWMTKLVYYEENSNLFLISINQAKLNKALEPKSDAINSTIT